MPELKAGTQIIYVPSHASGNINHPDCEAGFVMSETTTTSNHPHYFCRYWSKSDRHRLRTLSNSEITGEVWLVTQDTRDQTMIDKLVTLLKHGYPEHIPEGQWEKYAEALIKGEEYGKEKE